MGLLPSKEKEQVDGEPQHSPTKSSKELMGEEQRRGLAYSPQSGGQNPGGEILGPTDRAVNCEENLEPEKNMESTQFGILLPVDKSTSLEGNRDEESFSQGNTGSNDDSSQESPSNENKEQSNTAPSVKGKPRITVEESSMGEAAPECKFRRGKCINHDIMGERRVISTKKWGHKKTGFGWIYGKKVVWVCKARNMGPADLINSTSESEPITFERNQRSISRESKRD